MKPAMQEFEDIYSPFLTSMTTLEWSPGSSQVHQDLSQAAKLHHLELLPKAIQHQLMTKWRPGDNRHKDVEDVLKVGRFTDSGGISGSRGNQEPRRRQSRRMRTELKIEPSFVHSPLQGIHHHYALTSSIGAFVPS